MNVKKPKLNVFWPEMTFLSNLCVCCCLAAKLTNFHSGWTKRNVFIVVDVLVWPAYKYK